MNFTCIFIIIDSIAATSCMVFEQSCSGADQKTIDRKLGKAKCENFFGKIGVVILVFDAKYGNIISETKYFKYQHLIYFHNGEMFFSK